LIRHSNFVIRISKLMTPQSPAQFAICSWSTHPKDPADLAARLADLGLDKVQMNLSAVRTEPAVWGRVQDDLRARGVSIVSGMFGTVGEDYSTLETIRQTGGFIPDKHWDENFRIAREIAAIARDMRLTLVSTHAGFLTADAGDPNTEKLLDRLARVAGEFERAGATLLFETGQETADTLAQFLDALEARGARNVGINFDPANMILYDKGDPIASLRKLLPRARQVHIKDAVRAAKPGTWGTEVPIGEGQVDWAAFIETLAGGDFRGHLVIEREAGQDRAGDVRKAIDRLGKIMQAGAKRA
jgi:sugar phosphate isomerase/epimerase